MKALILALLFAFTSHASAQKLRWSFDPLTLSPGADRAVFGGMAFDPFGGSAWIFTFGKIYPGSPNGTGTGAGQAYRTYEAAIVAFSSSGKIVFKQMTRALNDNAGTEGGTAGPASSIEILRYRRGVLYLSLHLAEKRFIRRLQLVNGKLTATDTDLADGESIYGGADSSLDSLGFFSIEYSPSGSLIIRRYSY